MKTIHGWDVIESGSDPLLKDFTIPGTKRKIKLRKDIGPYLVAFASEYHAQIAPIDQGTLDDWGWCPVRKGRASNKISDHCAGVAMDLNATKEGSQSKSNVFWVRNPKKALAMRSLLRRYSLLEWGGNYSRAWDPMHLTFAYGTTEREVKAAMKRMNIDSLGRIRTIP